jgi:hypothetical protein
MTFQDIQGLAQWQQYVHPNAAAGPHVTYLYVLDRALGRVSGNSDILYIGETTNGLHQRYYQEVRQPDPWANGIVLNGGTEQQTNIRLRHLHAQLNGPQHITVWYTPIINMPLPADWADHKAALMHWHRNLFKVYHQQELNGLEPQVNLEQYLLVKYASEHLELPPWNNRF